MSELSRIIADEIRENGPIPFARFMELALYCPVYGYYERDADTVGKRGDFQTSVSVGRAFGELLAFQFSLWLEQLKAGGATHSSAARPACTFPDLGMNQTAQGKLQIVEAGAHDGRLAQDILCWFKTNRPELWHNLEYVILEPSQVRLERQRMSLADDMEHVRWFADFAELMSASGPVHGVIFCNELLDAMPVHRFGWDRAAGCWFEWCVDEHNDEFIWSRGAWCSEAVQAAAVGWVPRELLASLPDGYVVEASPAAVEWWRFAANALVRGWLMTFDYGFDDASVLMPERASGTLRRYHHHRADRDILHDPGEQDITAHVHFGLIQQAGENAGLRTEFLGEQGRFLTNVFGKRVERSGSDETPGPEWVRQFKTLIHPDHFGRAFQVMVQSRRLWRWSQ